MLEVLFTGIGLSLLGSILVTGVLTRHQGFRKGRFLFVLFSSQSPIHLKENRWDVRRLIVGFFITSFGSVAIGTHFLILENEKQSQCLSQCEAAGYSVGLPGPSAKKFDPDGKPLAACWCKSDKNKKLIELD